LAAELLTPVPVFGGHGVSSDAPAYIEPRRQLRATGDSASLAANVLVKNEF
jgi:hypothetical protein